MIRHSKYGASRAFWEFIERRYYFHWEIKIGFYFSLIIIIRVDYDCNLIWVWKRKKSKYWRNSNQQRWRVSVPTMLKYSSHISLVFLLSELDENKYSIWDVVLFSLKEIFSNRTYALHIPQKHEPNEKRVFTFDESTSEIFHPLNESILNARYNYSISEWKKRQKKNVCKRRKIVRTMREKKKKIKLFRFVNTLLSNDAPPSGDESSLNKRAAITGMLTQLHLLLNTLRHSPRTTL